MRVALLLALAVATATADPSGGVVICTSFEGGRGPGWKQTADISGAVGPKHTVAFDAGGFVVNDKATGRVLVRMTPREFWNHVDPPLNPQKDPNDPKIIYDPLSQRFFATCAGNGPGYGFLAVSTSSDPTQPWKGVQLPIPPGDLGMKIGVDRNGLYLCAHNGKSDPSQSQNCYAIPKADAIAPGGPILDRMQTLSDLQYAAAPAMDLDPNKPADAPAILLNNEFSDAPTSGKLYLYRITWHGPKASMSKAQSIPLSRAWPTGRQMEGLQPPPGPRLRAVSGARADSIVIHGGSVFGCHNVKRQPGSRVGILWYEVRIRDGALLQEGLVDSPDCDYLYPSLALDANGNLGIGCTRTSEKEFPSVCVMMRAPSDPPNTMRAPVVAVKGTTYYHYAGVEAANWSHYSSTCVDPADPNLLWTYQAYSNSSADRQWCAAWAAFRMPPSSR